MKELICIVCPRGCHITVDEETMAVKGNTCPRGEAYAKKEVTNPTRVLTSTVRLVNGAYPRLPVKTVPDIPKSMLFQVMRALDDVTAVAPVRRGDVLVRNVCGTGAEIVATRDMDAL